MSQHDSKGGHVLITGSSTGIGRAAALHLARRGYTVWAGVRREPDGAELERAAGGSIHGVILDVTDAASIRLAFDKIMVGCGDRGLAALVNNAGIVVAGVIETLKLEDWRRQLEVNVIGQIAVTQAMLPLLRRHVEVAGAGRARIVMIGSVAGRIGQPVVAAYCASKFALEAISDSLRIELKSQGIGVSLIEPGAIKSELWRKGLEQGPAMLAQMDEEQRQRYGKLMEAVQKLSQTSSDTAIPADKVAVKIERCLRAKRAPRRILVGRDARIGANLRRFLPNRMFDFMFDRMLGN
jgi:NAD(P)-dependent dehydrogenase (short-subunit alcohol dehydrogenase family)